MTSLTKQLQSAEAGSRKLTNQRQIMAWTMIGFLFVGACSFALFGLWAHTIICWISWVAFWVGSRIESARHEITVALLSAAAVEGSDG